MGPAMPKHARFTSAEFALRYSWTIASSDSYCWLGKLRGLMGVASCSASSRKSAMLVFVPPISPARIILFDRRPLPRWRGVNDRFVMFRESRDLDHKELFSLNLCPIILLSCL